MQPAPPLDPAAPAAAWGAAASLTLPWDASHSRPADEPTTVTVATDGRFLYVRFQATEHEHVTATQRSDDTVVGGSNVNGGIAWTDDAVWVDLWPTGPAGFEYQFESNPIGAHNEASSENAAFAPHWSSRGTIGPDGYTVTMAIPLAVVHGAHAGTWRMQFVRYVRATGALDVWSSDPSQTNPDTATIAGTMTFPVLARPPLPQPRLDLYGLGALAAPSAGGSTSRAGADFSIPVSQTASFYGTFHPDYSNVELDQQSISPTVYQRYYSEVRPFFTQASGFYNQFNCDVCSGAHTILYTPAIPTRSQGYAFEGRQGAFGFAAFDAIGVNRDDNASALDYTSSDNHWNASVEHVSADLPGLVDDATEAGVSWSNGKELSAYANAAQESGTLITDPSQAKLAEFGGGWSNQKFAAYGAVREIGAQFDPVDGFSSHSGIAGYALYTARVWTFSPNSPLLSAGAGVFVDRYAGPTFGQAQSDNSLTIDLLTKSAWDLQIFSGSDYWRFGPLLEPISQNGGVALTYHSGLQNNLNNFPSHGSSATPTEIQYYTGRYGTGRLDTWYRTSTMRVGDRGFFTIAIDDTAQRFGGRSPDNVQWFDSLSYSYQIASNSSLAIGLRRVTGVPPFPNGGGNCVGACSNVSVAYHLRLAREEFYLAYGDPNTLTTVPQLLLKVIFYAGGNKGT
ncbi:MAG TPA: hypothetical protein VFB22_10125 [Candidatus Baltobacteraceae bacterium]|nr:hypothetical protein [Candidatus Baltobacteraceae bacterium]